MGYEQKPPNVCSVGGFAFFGYKKTAQWRRLVAAFKSTWRGWPVNGHRKTRLLLNPIERNPVLLPLLQAGHVASAGIPQVNDILTTRPF